RSATRLPPALENNRKGAPVGFGPYLAFRACLDGLAGFSKKFGIRANLSIQLGAHVNNSADALNRTGLFLRSPGRVAGDHSESIRAQAAELDDHFFRQPFTEVRVVVLSA